MLERLGEFANGWMTTILAVILPLAGLLLTIFYVVEKRNEDATRTAAGTVLGIFLYILIFT